MRDIKFRAWDKSKKEMIFDGIEYCLRMLNLPQIFGEPKPALLGFFDEDDGRLFEVMQYTGLKDKNSKEIYEGDILYEETQSRDDPAYGIYGNHGVVEFKSGSFIVEFEHEFPELLSDVNKYCGIVGNIHENPELIE